MIPPDKAQAVERALRDTFAGSVAISHLQPLSKGLNSSLRFRLNAAGKQYILRIATRPVESETDAARPYQCMNRAAEAGLAPRLLYANAADRISIHEAVDTVEFPLDEARERLPGVVRALHQLPPIFDKPWNYPPVLAALKRFQSACPWPGAVEVFEQFDALAAVYPKSDEDIVSSHNDLKPENIVLDRSGRIQLLDWEAAYLNDRYFDLSVLANFLELSSPETEAAFLGLYFNDDPTASDDDYRSARFQLMRQFVHLMYAAFFWLMGGASAPAGATDGPLPDFDQFHRQIRRGEADLTTPAAKAVYARLHWERLRDNVRSPGFEQALRIVGGRNHPNAQRLLSIL